MRTLVVKGRHGAIWSTVQQEEKIIMLRKLRYLMLFLFVFPKRLNCWTLNKSITDVQEFRT